MADDNPYRETENRVRDLVMAEGWSIRGAQSADAAWVFLAEDAQGKRIVFGQGKGRPDFIEMQATISVDATHQAKFDALPPDELDEFLWELRFGLLSLDTNFRGVERPFRRVALTLRVYRDELEAISGLPRALQRMNKAMLVVLWMINRKMNQPAPPEEVDGITVN